MKFAMKFFLIFVITSFFVACGGSKTKPPVAQEFRVMSFNIWVGGGKSVVATAEVLVNSSADIIGVQEATRDGKNTAVMIGDSLGWHSYQWGASTTILSRYPIIDTSANKKGVKIRIDGKRCVWMFNTHLVHCPYEPYQLNDIEYCGAPFLSTAAEAIESATRSRGEEVKMIIEDIQQVSKEGYPVFLTGDFNEPSCLDWTKRATDAGMCKMAVEWPSTKSFLAAGMKDSYRTVFPDEVANPGYTWTTLPETEKYEEVHDRIDFVLYSGNMLNLTNCVLLGDDSALSDIKFADYPSDHRAVMSTFVWQ